MQDNMLTQPKTQQPALIARKVNIAQEIQLRLVDSVLVVKQWSQEKEEKTMTVTVSFRKSELNNMKYW